MGVGVSPDGGVWAGMGTLASPGGGTTAGTGAGAAPQVPVLTWAACHGGFQCATARVPLDYRHPDGAKIKIAVVRHLATDPAKRIGSLFVNGGGPNEQIEGFLAQYSSLPATWRERFDIISFDPRGIGLSTAVRCFPSEAAEQKFLSVLPGGFPVGAEQVHSWERTFARFDALCGQRNGSLLDHVTSADSARDMNLLREAVGDPKLNFVGLSYATGLGAIYANLFPAHVGHMILDGNMNPVEWTTREGSLTTPLRLHQDVANAAEMSHFLTLCGKATTAACAFSAGTPAATHAKWNTLLSRLRKHPITAGSPPQTITYADVISSVPLPEVAFWQQGAAALQQLWLASSGSRVFLPSGAFLPAHQAAATQGVYTGQEQTIAVFCSDSPNPHDLGAYAADARLANARAGGFGPEWLWDDEACAQWPGHGQADAYDGPWNKRTATTILMLANTNDAQLPYQDQVAMAHDLGRARLLTVRGYGHTEELNPSTCATNDETRYLTTGALPRAGAVCQEDGTPFPAP